MSRILKIASISLVIAMFFGALAFAAPRALASDGTFNVNVYHGINGKTLGLSKELPVIAYVYRNGEELAQIPLEFKDRVAADLPAGNYTIKIFSTELGAFVSSMQVGPVEIPEGVSVRLQAKLGAGLTPMVMVKVK